MREGREREEMGGEAGGRGRRGEITVTGQHWDAYSTIHSVNWQLKGQISALILPLLCVMYLSNQIALN